MTLLRIKTRLMHATSLMLLMCILVIACEKPIIDDMISEEVPPRCSSPTATTSTTTAEPTACTAPDRSRPQLHQRQDRLHPPRDRGEHQ